MSVRFAVDACANEQNLKCLTVVDEYTRQALAIDVAGRLRLARVIEVLARLVGAHGAPRVLRSNNGHAFVSRVVLRWRLASGTDTAHIDPGRPWRNPLDERQLQVPLRVPPRRVVMPQGFDGQCALAKRIEPSVGYKRGCVARATVRSSYC